MEYDELEYKIKNLKILKPTRLIKKVVKFYIREHEKRFEYEGPLIKIEYLPLKSKDDYKYFTKEKEYTLYRRIKDRKFAIQYQKMMRVMAHLSINLDKIAKTNEFQMRAVVDFFKILKF